MEITTMGGAIVLVALIIGIFCYYKFCVPKTADKEAAERFIKGYTSVFESTIERIIKEIDITIYKTIEEFESDIFGIAYDECWDYTEAALQEACANSAIASLVAKCITKERVEKYVKAIINEGFMNKLELTYTSRWNETAKAAEEEDLKLQHEADLYETGEKEVDPAPELPEVDTEAGLNPQRDEEEGYDPEDISQEIVTEEESVHSENNEELEEVIHEMSEDSDLGNDEEPISE